MTQLEIGIDVESEHEPTYEWLRNFLKENKKLPPKIELYKKIAEDHLNEYDDYYTRLMNANL